MKTPEEDAESLVRHRNRARLTSDERNDTMYSEKSFKEVGKALREEQTVQNPAERNTRLRPQGLGRQASSTRQSWGGATRPASLRIFSAAVVDKRGRKGFDVVTANARAGR